MRPANAGQARLQRWACPPECGTRRGPLSWTPWCTGIEAQNSSKKGGARLGSSEKAQTYGTWRKGGLQAVGGNRAAFSLTHLVSDRTNRRQLQSAMLLGGAGSLATCGLQARTTTPSSSRLAAGRPAAPSTRPLCLPRAKKTSSAELPEGLSGGQVQLGQARLPWLPEVNPCGSPASEVATDTDA